MKIVGPLFDATFVDRPNRFLTIVKIDGIKVKSHLPDPGRLEELLLPGATLKVRPVSPQGPLDNGQMVKRKTEWTTVMVKTSNQWVSIDTTLPNRFVKWLLEKSDLPFLTDFHIVKQEVTVGHHRFDFLLDGANGLFYLEVKSVTLVDNGVAMFPDAVTVRGKRHLEALAEMSNEGKDTGVLFVCQRPDVVEFRPQWNRDPKFSKALINAEAAGVKIRVISANVSPTKILFEKEIPYKLGKH
ncbi:MAG: DNA/RNA nuclease SfsA [Candidatus Marinimicrobia bacterium]|nr:DNA/RNA nuclease SfsA [Candidatus Neomarinimicrobiota bacterium]